MDLSDVIPVEFDVLTVVFLMRGPEPRPELSDEDLDRRRPPAGGPPPARSRSRSTPRLWRSASRARPWAERDTAPETAVAGWWCHVGHIAQIEIAILPRALPAAR